MEMKTAHSLALDSIHKPPAAGENLISGHQQRWPATSRGGPGPFQGPSSYPQLCWWSLIFSSAVKSADVIGFAYSGQIEEITKSAIISIDIRSEL